MCVSVWGRGESDQNLPAPDVFYHTVSNPGFNVSVMGRRDRSVVVLVERTGSRNMEGFGIFSSAWYESALASPNALHPTY